jgi:hypothetical protein
MASTADDVVYELSQENQNVPEHFSDRQMIWVNDTNNRSYNGQVSFECSSFTNSGRWINYSEGFIQIPLVWGWASSVDRSAELTGALGLGLKNGYHQLIDSLEVLFGNLSVTQNVSFSNIFNTFKMLTTFSQDSLAKYGALLNFFPDSWESSGYVPTTDVYGFGTFNNNVVYTLPNYSANASYPTGTVRVNEGFLKRLYNTNIPATLNDPTKTQTTVPWAFNTSGYNALGRAHWRSTGAGIGRVYYTQAIATIRLKDISDFFAKLGMTKNAYIKFTINTNTANCLLPIAGGDSKYVPAGTQINLQGRSNPLMISANVANSALAVASAAAQDISIGIGVGTLTIAGQSITNSMMSSCRLYVPSYQMLPEAESQYLELHPTREIVYQDLYPFVIGSVPGGQAFSQILSNNVINPQYVLTVPFINSASGNNVTGTTLSPLSSPFASEPGTSSPGLSISQYNVQVSGRNIYQQNINYDFENFVSEIAQINALNGGQLDDFSSGLLSYDMWNSCYRFYVTDLSRGSVLDSMVPKAIQVSGVNSTTKIVDYYGFVVYKRKITIKTIDSQFISAS